MASGLPTGLVIMVYRFGAFTLDAKKYLLSHQGRWQRIAPAALRLLLLLVERAGELVTKAELAESLWPGESGNVARPMSVLRKVLGEERREGRFIQTISKHGYRFVAPVTAADAKHTPVDFMF